MNQTFWAGIGGACITAIGGITGALLAAVKNGSAQRDLDESERREATYRRFIEQVKAGEDPRRIFLGPADDIPACIITFREKYGRTGFSEEDLTLLVADLEDEIAKERESTKKNRKAAARFSKISLTLFVSTIAFFIVAAFTITAFIVVAFAPKSQPAKLIMDIFDRPGTHHAIPSSRETPSVTPSWIPTPSNISTPIQGTSPSTAAIAGQTGASQKPTTIPSPNASSTPTAGSGALPSPSCGSGDAVSCVSQVVSGVVSTCASASAQSTPSTNLPGDISGVVGSATKCMADATTAVVPVPSPSPSATATASSLSLP
jgi:hypothetical protein